MAYARHIAMYLSRNLTEASLPQIGARFGGRHHTTVIHAVDKFDRQLNTVVESLRSEDDRKVRDFPQLSTHEIHR